MRVSRLDKKQSPVLEAWCIETCEIDPDGEPRRVQQPGNTAALDDYELKGPRDDDTDREQKSDLAAPCDEPSTGTPQIIEAGRTAGRSLAHAPTAESAASRGTTIVAVSTLFWAPMAWVLNWIC
jgi:hypothetical protein